MGGPVPEGAPVGTGPVVLDIGGDIGALLVLVPESLEGEEIDICVAGGAPFAHTGVHLRGPDGHQRLTAVYPSLTTGDYQLLHPADGSPLGGVVHVEGGSVAQLDLGDWVPAAGPVWSGGHHHHGDDGPGHGHGHSHG